MAEKPEASGGLRKMKKLEKPQVANNREYLDMDTDEEEFGKQETPEPEEELEVEPEKPVFTDEQLNTLVRYVKNLTTVPNLEESNWCPDVTEIVKEYFSTPANTVLTIFHDSGRLRGSLNFPERTDAGLTYFLRSPWQIYTTENFLSTVIFGSVDDEIGNSTLKFLDNMYAPIAFNGNDWPTGILCHVMRNEVFSNLHKFLMCLTDAAYVPMGLTILYVPREGLEDEITRGQITNIESSFGGTIEENNWQTGDNEAEGLIERLERVARYWIKQIGEALNGTCYLVKSSACKTIIDEIKYWHHRYENLSCVYHQLTNKSVVAIVEKLKRERSASVKRYNFLLTQVRAILNEATSNITYLNLLEEFNEGFVIPDGVEEYSTRILLLIRFIGMESPFYHGEEKMEKLSRAFCAQTVEHLQRYIDLNIIFHGNPDDGRKMVEKCIDCCQKMSNIFDRLVKIDESTNSPVLSFANKTQVFNHVSTFVQRCIDLIGIAESRTAFDKSNETITFSGPRGIKLATHYRKIEKQFSATLCELKNARNDILDIVSSKWLGRIVNFNNGIRNIENMVKNWINDIFMDILNVEEGIGALHGIKRFFKRSQLRETLNDKWIQIWKIFGRELDSFSVITNENSGLLHHPSLPVCSGNANVIRSSKIYLTEQYKMLIDASDWFDDCDAQKAITKKYKCVLAAMTEKEDDLFLDWQKSSADKKINPEILSTKSIIKYHNSKFETISVNLDTHYLDNIREIGQWTILNYETNNIFSKNCPKWQILKSRYNKVESVCKLYNGIFEATTRTKGLLFSTLLDDLEDTMSSGFKRTTWTSESFERFFTDCMEIMIKIQDSLETYRSINWKIDDTRKDIAITSLVNCERNLIEMLEDSISRLEQDRLDGATRVGKKCKIILNLLLKLKMRINIDEPQTLDYWNYYIGDIYEKLKISFINCLRLSMLGALDFLRGDYIGGSSAFVKIDVDYIMIKRVENEITKIKAAAFEEAFPIDEFIEVFGAKEGIQVFIKCIDGDIQTIKLRTQIDEFFNPIYTSSNIPNNIIL